MKKQLLGAAAALAMLPLAAQAGEPMTLTDVQMDQVTAGLADVGAVVGGALTSAILAADPANTFAADADGLIPVPDADGNVVGIINLGAAPAVAVPASALPDTLNTVPTGGTFSNEFVLTDGVLSPELAFTQPNPADPSTTVTTVIPDVQYGSTSPEVNAFLVNFGTFFNF